MSDFGKRREPCGDCIDGRCTMNCGPRIPADVRSAFLGAIGQPMTRTMRPINACEYEAPRDPTHVLRVRGVGRIGDNPRALLVLLTERPTDDEIRDIHEVLREWLKK